MLSVLIPSFNHEKYVLQSIKSAVSINIPGRQIVIIDDGSTDNSVKIISEFLASENNKDVTFIDKKINKGVIDTVNMFLRICETEYVYFMASDDTALPSGLEALVHRLETDSQLDFAIGGGKNVFSDGSLTPIYGNRHKIFFNLTKHERSKALFLNFPSPLLCQSTVFRRSAIQDAGGFDSSLIADDYQLFVKLFLRGSLTNFIFLPEIECVLYRHHDNNNYQDYLRQARSVVQIIEKYATEDVTYPAIGERLAYYFLMALLKMNFITALKLVAIIPAPAWPWFLVGISSNTYKKFKRILFKPS